MSSVLTKGQRERILFLPSRVEFVGLVVRTHHFRFMKEHVSSIRRTGERAISLGGDELRVEDAFGHMIL